MSHSPRPESAVSAADLVVVKLLLSTDKADVSIVKFADSHTGAPFVAKIYKSVPFSHFGTDIRMKQVLSRYVRERCVLAQCYQHPNIVNLYEPPLGTDSRGASTSRDQLQPIYLELMELGSLKDVCAKVRLHPGMTPELLCGFAKAVAVPCVLGLRYLHSQQIIHRDVKPENILLSRCGITKWCDFDSCSFDNPETVDVGTKGYGAPEMVRRAGEQYTDKIDLWGMGCVLYWVVMGGDMSAVSHFDLDAIPDAELRDLLRRLLQEDPDRRVNANDALQHDALCPAFYKKTTVAVSYTDMCEYFTSCGVAAPTEGTDAAEIEQVVTSKRIAVEEYDRLRVKHCHTIHFWRQRHAVMFIRDFLALWTDASYSLVPPAL
jgi:serine/threonine protein kinase